MPLPGRTRFIISLVYLGGSISFWSEEYAEEGHYWKGKRLSIDEPWLPVEEIFNFSTDDFKSFESWVDNSD